MNSTDKEFLDAIATEDSGLKGFVILKDAKTGKTLVKKHNMIVTFGKKYFFEKFLANNLISAPGNSTIFNYTSSTYEYELLGLGKDYKLIKAAFGVSGKEVEFTDTTILPLTTVDPLKGNAERNLLVFKLNDSSGSSGSSDSESSMMVNIDQDSSGHYFLKYEFSFSGENVIGSNVIETVQELGLFLSSSSGSDMNSGDDNADKLFSRIRFDKIPITADSEFILTYYIYF